MSMQHGPSPRQHVPSAWNADTVLLEASNLEFVLVLLTRGGASQSFQDIVTATLEPNDRPAYKAAAVMTESQYSQ